MPLASFDELYQDADRRAARVTVAVAGGADRTVIEALHNAVERGWVRPLVVGQEREIRQVADQSGHRLQGFTLVESEDPAGQAVALVRSGQAQLLMKGQIATPTLLRAMLDPTTGLRTCRVICQVVLMEVFIRPEGKTDGPAVARRFLLADTGICIHPTVDQNADILQSAVEVAHRLGETRPKVALLAATEKVDAAMPETIDAAELQRRHQAGEIPGAVVEGPLSFDLAVAPDASEKKRVGGSVPGAADVLLFPNLLSGNLTVTALMCAAACRFGGILCGAACPEVFMSRADTATTRLNSLALALALAQGLPE